MLWTLMVWWWIEQELKEQELKEHGQILACSPDQSPSYTLPLERAAVSQKPQFVPRKNSMGMNIISQFHSYFIETKWLITYHT